MEDAQEGKHSKLSPRSERRSWRSISKRRWRKGRDSPKQDKPGAMSSMPSWRTGTTS